MSLDGNGRYCALDPREGTKLIVAECCRNLSTVGAIPIATTNNLNFGNPERPEIMAQIVESIEGLAEACRFFEAPVTGGNVSLYNETLGDSDFSYARCSESSAPCGQALPLAIPFQERADDVSFWADLGTARCTRVRRHSIREGRSESLWGIPPALDMDYEKRVQAAFANWCGGRVESAHDLSEGGLAVALAECSFGPGMSARTVNLIRESARRTAAVS